MIKYCVNKWNKNYKKLKEALERDTALEACCYTHLVKLVVENIYNEGADFNSETWNVNKITEIDNGDYQGTLLWLIPSNTYQPDETEYLITFANYGSCSGCDTLQSIQSRMDVLSDEEAIKEFMQLCKDLVCNTIKPYNYGWRNNKDFDVIEEK